MQLSLSAELYDKAEEVCKKLVQYNPNNSNYWITYKQITAYNKNYENTLFAISELERISGKTTNLTLEKSAVLQELNDIDNAIKILVEVHIPDSSELDIVKRLVSLYLEKKILKMLPFLMIYYYEYPDDQSGYINAAIISLNNDSPEKAITYLKPNIDKYKDNYSALYLLGILIFKMKIYQVPKNISNLL